MEDIEVEHSPHQPTPTPAAPNPNEVGKNPPLAQSSHNPDNKIAKFIAELLANPQPDSSVVISADKAKNLLSLLGIGKLKRSINNINACLDSIERAIKAVLLPIAVLQVVHNALPAPPRGWENAVKKTLNNVPICVVPRVPPINKVMNEFKPSFFVIRKTIPELRTFFQMSPDQINKKNRIKY
jgi:hypothetical protein